LQPVSFKHVTNGQVTHPKSRVHQERTTVMGGPSPILDILAPMDNCPRPGLPDR
jgi:hypothetical protein